MRLARVVLIFLVIIAIVCAKRSRNKKSRPIKSFGKDGVVKHKHGMVVDYGTPKKRENKISKRKMKLENLMPVVNSPDSPYKEEWKRITQYQEGQESLECQKLKCKKKQVCLLDKETLVAKCISKKELKRAKKLVKKYYEKQKGIKAVEKQKSPELGPMQTHKKKKKKNKDRKNKSKKQWKKEKSTHIRTTFDQIGEESFHSDFVEGKGRKQITGVTTKDNEVGNSEVLKTECDEKEMGELKQRLADWFYSVQQSMDPKNQLEKAKESLLIQKPKKNLKRKKKDKGGKKRHNKKRKARDVFSSEEKCECRDPITWEFLHLDTDNSTLLSSAELKEIESNPFENCITTFMDECDLDSSGDLSYPEWCCCFTNYLPPCFNSLRNLPTQMIRGQVVVVPGTFIPRCTPQGYYTSQQCDQEKGECWCVDNLGTERVGTRKNGEVKCD